jgi:hypothetical protein
MSSKSDKKAAEQHRRFIHTARDLGCDEDPEAFERAIKKLAKAPPAPRRERAKKDGDKAS